MKKIEKIITVYITDDGKEFNSENEALSYYNNKIFEENRKKVLTEYLINEFKSIFHDSIEDIEKLTFELNLKGESKIFYNGNQFDENFDGLFDDELFSRLQEIMRLKYGFNLTIPYWYYSK